MIICRTPLRVSLLGGGSDLPDFYRDHVGAVLTTAIDKYVYVIVKQRFDSKIVLNYKEREVVESVDDIKHDIIREVLRMLYIQNGIEITTLADIPSEGSGLGSSSSITVCLLQSLYAYKNESVTQEQLAKRACYIELNVLKRPIGIQDQWIAAFGGFRLLTFTGCTGAEVIVKSVSDHQISDLQQHLMLCYTGLTRDSSYVLADQKSNIPNRINSLIELSKLAHKGYSALTFNVGGVAEIGDLLARNWELKKSLSDRVSSERVDSIYQIALEAGAISGKLCGAGYGGFLLLYVDPEKRKGVRNAMYGSGLTELPFRFDPYGSRIVYDGR